MNARTQPDPIRAHQRNAIAARRVGEGAQCSCGEVRSRTLIPGRKPDICAECQRLEQGKCSTDDHHVAGNANSPITITVPVNDHRAVLSVAQLDWPKETLENPNSDELLKLAASLRGYIDTNDYLVNKFLRPLPEVIEAFAKNRRRKTKTNTTKKEKQHATKREKQKQTTNRGARLSSAAKSGARQPSQ
jgi:hypothetical protein